MVKKIHPIQQMVLDAISDGSAVPGKRILELRDKSEKEISLLKKVFWVSLGIFNLMVWYPFTSPLPTSVRFAVGILSLFIAIFFPIIGIRRNRSRLKQLEDCSQGLKRRKTDEAGRQYMDQVKKQKRLFVHAEYLVLQGEPPSE